jgi:hypothetical protein
VTKRERAASALTRVRPREASTTGKWSPSHNDSRQKAQTARPVYAITLTATADYSIHDLRAVLKLAGRRHLRCVSIREVLP